LYIRISKEESVKKLSFLCLGLLAVAALSLFALAVDVSGTWELTSQSPRGERTSDITITQEGDAIKVTMPGRQGDEITGEGMVSGNDIEWTITRSTQQGEFSMTYKGTVEGDTMSGTVEIRDNTNQWTAKKKS
jgi:hypothetical protein